MSFKKDEMKFNVKRDNLIIRGKVYLNSDKSKLPAIIISHEFGLNMRFLARYAKCLYKQGYAVFIYDFCGSGVGTSDGKSADMSVLTQKEDLSAVLDYVKTLDYIDNEHIILMGCSQGGLVTALVAAERAEEIEKMILFYPAFNIPDNARQCAKLCKKLGMKDLPKTFGAMHIKLSKKFIEDALSIEPWKEICAFTKPVLIVHGGVDNIVPFRYSKIASKKYTDCRLVKIKFAQHMFLTTACSRALKQAIYFLKE